MDADLCDFKALVLSSPLHCLQAQFHLLDFNEDPIASGISWAVEILCTILALIFAVVLLLPLWAQMIETLCEYVSYFKMLSVKLLIKYFSGRPHLEIVIQMLRTTLASSCQTAVQVMSTGRPPSCVEDVLEVPRAGKCVTTVLRSSLEGI